MTQPRINRFKTGLWNLPKTRAFKLLMCIPLFYLGYTGLKSVSNTFFGGGGWAQDGTINIFGRSFHTPKKTFIEFVRTYMGGVIHEVLADPKVN